MKTVLIHSSPLWLAIKALRKCWSSENKSDSCFMVEGAQQIKQVRLFETNIEPPWAIRFVLGPSDRAALLKAIEQDHTSTMEHISFTFDVEGISRGCLQELARHRIASLSVQSSRYTLNHLIADGSEETIRSLLVSTGDPDLDELNVEHMKKVARLARIKELRNDTVKYGIVEAYKTTLVWTINVRSLRNFLKLRTAPAAHREIRQLAYGVYHSLPTEYKELFVDVIRKERDA